MTAAALKEQEAPKQEEGTKAPEGNPGAKRTFSFETSFTIPVPADLPKRTPAQTDLPFKGWFSDNLAAALEGKQPHLFVPDAYWILEREAAPKDVNASYGRSKVMDQFRKWQYVHKDGKNTKVAVKGHEGVFPTIVYRTGKEQGFTEPGISIWLLKAQA